MMTFFAEFLKGLDPITQAFVVMAGSLLGVLFLGVISMAIEALISGDS